MTLFDKTYTFENIINLNEDLNHAVGNIDPSQITVRLVIDEKIEDSSGKTKFFLVQYEGDWADEMDINGTAVMSETQMYEYFGSFKKYIDRHGDFIFNVGTNEEIEYDSFEEFRKAFTTKEITGEEMKVLIKLDFYLYGHFPDSSDLDGVEDEK